MGSLKVEDIGATPQHPESHFTDQDELLIEMMANIIATVVYNTQVSEEQINLGKERVGYILKQLGLLTKPVNAAHNILSRFVGPKETDMLDQVTNAFTANLDREPIAVEKEAKAFYETGARPVLYQNIACRSRNDAIRRRFALFGQILHNKRLSGNWEQVLKQAAPWQALYDSADDPDRFARAGSNVLGLLAKQLQTKITNSLDDTSLCTGVLKTKRIFGQTISEFPLVLFRQPSLANEQDELLEHVRALARGRLSRHYNIMGVVWWDGSSVPEYLKSVQKKAKDAFALDIAVLTRTDVLEVLASLPPEDSLRAFVLQQCTTASPFVIVGPVPDSMFFGRDKELRKIDDQLAQQGSCAVVGGRRIGKTSILHRLNNVNLPQAQFEPYFFDCSPDGTYDQFRSVFVDHQTSRNDDPPVVIRRLKILLERSANELRQVLLLDEADALVDEDSRRDWTLFRTFRALSNAGQIQLVLSGERALLQALGDPDGPLFNQMIHQELGPLSKEAVHQLISKPMHFLNIHLEDDRAITGRIYELTSGHPNVVQRLCHRLYQGLGGGQVHSIGLEDVEKVANDPWFFNEDFLDTFMARATPLEWLLMLLMSRNSSRYNDLESCARMLEREYLEVEIDDLKQALDNLVKLRLLLDYTRDGYRFRVPAFPQMLMRAAGTIDDAIFERKQRLHRSMKENRL